MALTVQTLNNVYVQTIAPSDFGIYRCQRKKKNIGISNYFNCGFFASTKEGTIPIGNLADCGVILSNSKDNPSWINVAKKKLSTIYTTSDGGCGFVKTDDLHTIPKLSVAISGIPIAINGKQVVMDEIRSEGYFGSELYDTWHGFLGIRDGGLVYVGVKCPFSAMFWILRALGIKTAIKLDGGGSYILHNDKDIMATDEDRVIDNIGMWSK